MKIIKRDGSEAVFDLSKIANAIKGASDELPENERLTARQIDYAAHNVADLCETAGHTVSVEEIQDMVENEIMALQKFEVAVGTSFTVTSRTSSAIPTPPTTKSLLSSNATTKRLSRKTPTRTLR